MDSICLEPFLFRPVIFIVYQLCNLQQLPQTLLVPQIMHACICAWKHVCRFQAQWEFIAFHVELAQDLQKHLQEKMHACRMDDTSNTYVVYCNLNFYLMDQRRTQLIYENYKPKCWCLEAPTIYLTKTTEQNRGIYTLAKLITHNVHQFGSQIQGPALSYHLTFISTTLNWPQGTCMHDNVAFLLWCKCLCSTITRVWQCERWQKCLFPGSPYLGRRWPGC